MLKGIRKIIAVVVVFCMFSPLIHASTTDPVQARVDAFIDVFVQNMVKKHQFEADKLFELFDQITVNKTVTHKMNIPYEAKPWHKYRKLFITEHRINGGLKYWNKHQEALDKAEKQYGVPANVILAILGVETSYGENKGSFLVLEALTTLAFNYPSRASFFKKELEHFLLLTREQKLDPLKIKGSYAGAIGLPQFIPSSYREYAVDFSGKHKIDLMNNHEDAIGSVANYLARNGWKRNSPVAAIANIKGAKFKKLLPNPMRPTYTLSKLNKFGVSSSEKLTPTSKALFFELDNENASEYWLGFHNFYVICRYNHSRLYALAVHQLSQALKQQHTAQLAKKNHGNKSKV